MSGKGEGSGLHCLFQRIGKSGQGEIKIVLVAPPVQRPERSRQ